jgi:DNA replication protein DnaC
MSGEDRDAQQAAAAAEWQAERQAIALRRWCEQIPAAQQTPGVLLPAVVDWVKKLTAGDTENLVMLGDVGTGKTWHAWHSIRHAYEAGWYGTAQFYSAYAWKRVVGPPLDADQIAAAATVDLLVLDDPGAHRLGEWDLENLLGVIDERWNNQRPTIFTSNASKLHELFGPRITSRIADGATVVTFEGKDLRRAR